MTACQLVELASTAIYARGSTISQEALEAAKRLQSEADDAKRYAREVEKVYDTFAAALIAALDGGAAIAKGPRSAAVEERAAIRPHWAEVFEKWNGKEAVELVKSDTEPTITRKLVLR